MYERFTDRAKKIMAMAEAEAVRARHESINTEHVLLALADEGSGVGAGVLKEFGVDLAWVRPEVEKLVKPGPGPVAEAGSPPQSPRVKRVIDFAYEESGALRQEQVGSEHLLLGLLREQDGIASLVLRRFGVTADKARQEIRNRVGASAEPDPPADPIPARPPRAAASTDYALAGRFGEAWFSVVIGAILLCMMPNTAKYFLSFAHLAVGPQITDQNGDIVPYIRSNFFLPDLGVDFFAAVLILDGIIMLIARRRGWLILPLGLMAIAVVLNLIAIIVAWPTSGFQIICALAVGFGGYRLFDLIARLRS